jgi:hypothetical protein
MAGRRPMRRSDAHGQHADLWLTDAQTPARQRVRAAHHPAGEANFCPRSAPSRGKASRNTKWCSRGGEQCLRIRGSGVQDVPPADSSSRTSCAVRAPVRRAVTIPLVRPYTHPPSPSASGHPSSMGPPSRSTAPTAGGRIRPLLHGGGQLRHDCYGERP